MLENDKASAHCSSAPPTPPKWARALTSRLLTFARRRRLEASVVDLNELVLGMAEIVQRTIGEHISLSTVLAPGCG